MSWVGGIPAPQHPFFDQVPWYLPAVSHHLAKPTVDTVGVREAIVAALTGAYDNATNLAFFITFNSSQRTRSVQSVLRGRASQFQEMAALVPFTLNEEGLPREHILGLWARKTALQMAQAYKAPGIPDHTIRIRADFVDTAWQWSTAIEITRGNLPLTEIIAEDPDDYLCRHLEQTGHLACFAVRPRVMDVSIKGHEVIYNLAPDALNGWKHKGTQGSV